MHEGGDEEQGENREGRHGEQAPHELIHDSSTTRGVHCNRFVPTVGCCSTLAALDFVVEVELGASIFDSCAEPLDLVAPLGDGEVLGEGVALRPPAITTPKVVVSRIIAVFLLADAGAIDAVTAVAHGDGIEKGNFELHIAACAQPCHGRRIFTMLRHLAAFHRAFGFRVLYNTGVVHTDLTSVVHDACS